eukprot:EG_transcript_4013
MADAFGPGAVKYVHLFSGDELGMFCPPSGCVVDLTQDVCFVETARYSRRDFARLLRNATAVVQVAGEPPGMADAVLHATLHQAALRVPSVTHFVFLARGTVYADTSLQRALWDYVAGSRHAARRPVVHLLRLFDVYGPAVLEVEAGLPGNALGQLAARAVAGGPIALEEGGLPYRDFVHVRDLVAALQAVLGFPMGIGPVDVATGEVTSVRKAAWLVADLAARCLWPQDNGAAPGPPSFRADRPLQLPTPMSSVVPTWKPRVALRPGVAQAMLHALQQLANRSAVPPGVDIARATACLRAAARPAEILPFCTASSQLGHDLLCAAPPPTASSAAPPRRTLVVLTGRVRSPHLTWLTFHHQVLQDKHIGTPVDFALAVSRTTDGRLSKEFNHFYRYAEYVWEIYDPPDNNFRHFFHEIATACFHHPFPPAAAQQLGRALQGNFLGRIKESKHPHGSATGLFFRWLVLQQVLHLRLWAKYGWLVLSRSDFLWTAPHPTVTNIQLGQVLIPAGQDWGGVNDRHFCFRSADAARVLPVCYGFLDRPVGEVITRLKVKNESAIKLWDYNGEWFFKWWLTSQRMEIRRCTATQYLVYDFQQPMQEGHQDLRIHMAGIGRLARIVVIPKYHNEHEEATLHETFH